MPICLKQGQYKEALEEIIQVLGPNEKSLHCSDVICEGCEWERVEAIRTAKAVLGLPVPRQRCKVCGALDQIYWHKGDPVPNREMSCHNCGTVKPESEWVDLPVDA